MPYEPLDYARPKGRNVRQLGVGLGAAVSAIPGEIRAKEEFRENKALREQAIKEAKEDWSTIENNWKTMRATYIRQARPLVQQGLMSEEEYNSNLERIRMPIKADQKDPGRYLDDLAKSSKELFGNLKTRGRQGQLGAAEQQALQPTKTQFTEEFDKALSTPPSQFQPSADPQAIQTPSQQAPEHQGQLAQRVTKNLAEEGAAPASKEEMADIQARFGGPTEQQFATRERQQAQNTRQKALDLVAADNIKVDNQLAKDRERRMQITANFNKTFKISAEEKKDIRGKMDYYNDQMVALNQNINLLKDGDQNESSQKLIDDAKLKLAGATKAKEESFKLLEEVIKKGKATPPTQPSGGESQDVTKARQAMAVAKDLIEKGDFSQYSKEQLTLIIQNAQNAIGQ